METSNAQDVGGFLAALRSMNGGYGTSLAPENGVTPFGAYGMLIENWDQWAAEAGLSGADFRDPSAQDAVAGFWSTKFFKRYGTWEMVANAWYAGQDQTDALVSQGLRAFTNDRIRAYTEAVVAAQEQMAGTPAPAAAQQWVNASTGSGWLMPVAGPNEYTNSFTVPRDNKLGIHGAIDIYSSRGTPIVAPVAGKIVSSKANSGPGGNWVQLQGNDGNLYYFAHMDGAPRVTKGQQVNAGMALGIVGNSGSASGTKPHLHFKISKNGRTLNPYSLLQGSANADGFFLPENADIPLESQDVATKDMMTSTIQSISDAVAGGKRIDYRTLGVDEEDDVRQTSEGQVML